LPSATAAPLHCHLLIGPPASGKTTLAKTLAPAPHPGPAAAGAGGVDRALGLQGPVGLQGAAGVHHRIHAGLPLGVGAHHPIGVRNPTVEDLSHPAWRWYATSGIRADEPQVVLGRVLNKIVMDQSDAFGLTLPWLDS
jgi:hypothetical protein